MNKMFVIGVVEVLLGCMLFVGLLVVLMAGWFDIRQIAKQGDLARLQRRLIRPRQPHVTLLVVAEPGASIVPSIAAIRRSRYYNYDIVVVDNDVHSEVRKDVGVLRQKYPTLPLRAFCKRKPAEMKVALRQAYARSARGDFVIIVRASMRLEPHTIKRAVAALQYAHGASVVYFGTTYAHPATILQTYAQLLGLGDTLLQKARGWALPGGFMRNDRPLMCRQRVFKNAKSFRVLYDPRATAVQLHADERAVVKRLLLRGGRRMCWLGAAAALSYLLVFAYSASTAATLQSASLVMVGWTGVTIWYSSMVWTSDAPGKSATLGLAPLMYVLLAIHALALVLSTVYLSGKEVCMRLKKIMPEPIEKFLLRHS